MQTVPGDAIFYLNLIRRRNCIFVLLIYQMVCPEETDRRGNKKQVYTLRLLNRIFELLPTEGNFTFVALFKIYKMPEETLCEQ